MWRRRESNFPTLLKPLNLLILRYARNAKFAQKPFWTHVLHTPNCATTPFAPDPQID